jgi:hypothetical protein
MWLSHHFGRPPAGARSYELELLGVGSEQKNSSSALFCGIAGLIAAAGSTIEPMLAHSFVQRRGV